MTTWAEVEAVLLAGGLGTRLRSEIPDRPKVLAPVGGRPLLDLLLDEVRRLGIRRAILALGWGADRVESHLRAHPRTDLEILTSVEPSPLGTGGAARLAASRATLEDLLVVNADTLLSLDDAFLEFHRSRPARATILAARVDDASRFGRIEADGDGRVLRWDEKPRAGGGCVNAGWALIRREALLSLPADRPLSLEREVYPSWCGRGLYAKTGTFRFLDIGTPESYRRAGEFVR